MLACLRFWPGGGVIIKRRVAERNWTEKITRSPPFFPVRPRIVGIASSINAIERKDTIMMPV